MRPGLASGDKRVVHEHAAPAGPDARNAACLHRDPATETYGSDLEAELPPEDFTS